MEWQPIETGPKDGTEILGWDGHEVVTVSWCESHEWSTGYAGFYKITHWMPLPQPPAQCATNEE